MDVRFQNGDYIVAFSNRADAESFIEPDTSISTCLPFRYTPKDIRLNDGSELRVEATNDVGYITGLAERQGRGTVSNEINFGEDEVGPIIRVHPSKIFELLRGEEVMRRIPGSNKIHFTLSDEAA